MLNKKTISKNIDIKYVCKYMYTCYVCVSILNESVCVCAHALLGIALYEIIWLQRRTTDCWDRSLEKKRHGYMWEIWMWMGRPKGGIRQKRKWGKMKEATWAYLMHFCKIMCHSIREWENKNGEMKIFPITT